MTNATIITMDGPAEVTGGETFIGFKQDIEQYG